MLAVIIPYYKKQFFYKTLLALALQTDKRFHVYVLDDASPESPSDVVNVFKNDLEISYKRFDENYGHFSPARHWNRCLTEVALEEWVCFLPDDDVPTRNFVAAFYHGISTLKDIDIFCMPSMIFTSDDPPSLDLNHELSCSALSVDDFYMKQLKGEAHGSSLGDNFFRLTRLLEVGGFREFPKAISSDHAAILEVAGDKDIGVLRGAVLWFRMSGLNISSKVDDSLIKLAARKAFLELLISKNTFAVLNTGDDFRKYFNWKTEFYVLNVWPVSFSTFLQFLKLRVLTIGFSRPHTIFTFSFRYLMKALKQFLPKAV